MAKKKVVIDSDSCIMCGTCVGAYPDDFKFNDDGTVALVTDVADEEAVDVCPSGAISVAE